MISHHETVLVDLIRRHGWRHGAEIGVLRGENLFYLLKHVPTLRMVAVDPWSEVMGPNAPPNHDTGDARYSGEAMGRHYAEVRAVVERSFKDRVKLLRMRSVEGAERVVDGSLDFVFIDGDHHEQAVRDDVAAWQPKLRPGGWLMGHDTNWNSVRRAVDAVVPGWQQLDQFIWAKEIA